MKFSGTLKIYEDFIVEEILSERFIHSYKRTGKGIEKSSGDYALFLLKKQNMNTMDVIKELEKKFQRSIGFAGLKDKKAVTSQYVTIKIDKINNAAESCLIKERHAIENISMYSDYKNSDAWFKLNFVKFVHGQLSPGDLRGNKFTITLHDCSDIEKLPKIIKSVRNGIPNFFGNQRFSEKNHIICRKIIRTGKSVFAKDLTKFYIHAYQSFLFNNALKKYLKKQLKLLNSKELSVPGYNTVLGNKKFDRILTDILKAEKISLRNFKIDKLGIMCRGSMRMPMIYPDISYEVRDNDIILRFTLPKGAYATVVLDHICNWKDER